MTESKIIEIVKYDSYRGVIFSSVKQVTDALVEFNGGPLKEPKQEDYEIIEFLFKKNAYNFMNWLVKNVKDDLGNVKKDNSYGCIHFGEGAMGTRFCGLGLKIMELGSKYVMRISDHPNSAQTEQGLAEKLNKPMALEHAGVSISLSRVGFGYQCEFELSSKIGNLPLMDKEKINEFADYFENQNEKKPKIFFEHKHKEYSLDIELDNLNVNRIHAMGTQPYVLGEATVDRNKKEIKTPKIRLELTLLDHITENLAIHKRQITALRDARDYLMNFISIYS